mmetsp:Transcript_14078/g.35891  ORF Transcript_14078/g.35891 Transcript_14078/m.35891 type:complete len:236 (-) Transcript_14078:112-819(-)
MPAEPVRGVGALDDGGELRVAHTGLFAGGADGAGSDADLDDVGAGEEELLDHFAGDDVAGDDGYFGKRRADAGDVFHEVFGVAVGDVEADELDGGVDVEAFFQAIEVRVRDPGARHRVGQRLRSEPVAERGAVDVLGERGEAAVLRERGRHGQRPRRVHVRRDDRDAGPGLAGVAEGEGAGEGDVGARAEGRALGADQDVLEVQLDFMLDAHGGESTTGFLALAEDEVGCATPQV